MSTTIYADSWTGSATSGKVTQRAYMTYTVTQTATTYQIIVQSGVQQWNPTWTKIKTVCTLTDQSSVTKTLTQSSGANHLHQFFNVTYATITKTSSAQSKTITGTSKITGGVDSAHGSGTVLNKTSTVSHVFNIPAELKVSGSTLISKTFSTSEQTATLAATGGTSPYTFIELGEQGNTNYFSISGSTLKIAANTPVGNHSYRVKVKDADGVSISVDYTIRIAKANISPTVSMANWTYGGTASTPSVSGNSGNGTVTYHYKVSTAADSTYTTTKPSNAGTYTVRASIAATTNYNAGTATKNFTISKATPTLSVTGATLTYSGSAQTLVSSASVTGGGTIYYGLGSSSTSAPGSWSTTKPTGTNAGTYYVWAKADATTNYAAVAATYKTSVTISQKEVTLTWGTVTWTYDGSAHSTTCTAGNLVSGTSCTVTLTGNSVGAAVGTATVTASSLSNNNYKLPSAKTKTLTINKREVTLTWGTVTWTYDGSAHSTTCTAGNLVSGTSCTVTLTGNSVGANVGTATVTAKSLSNSNYKLPSANTKTLTISQRQVTLTWGTLTWNYDGSAHSTTCTAGNLVSGTSCTVTLTGNSVGAAVGTATVTASGLSNSNYKLPSATTATLTIKPVMWLKFHANGGTIPDSPHKYDNSNYFKLNNSIVQRSATATGTYSDLVYTVTTSTTYLNLWNVSSYNITRPGYKIKSGAAAFNTATNGTGIDVNQDNTAAGDTNPITSKRLNGGTEITANVTKTLYVNWVADTFTITLNKNANDATAGTASVQITYGTTKGNYPSITKPTRPGYTFAGYYSATSGGTQWYDANGNSVRTFDLTANTTWYAHWTVNSYTLTIDPNGGTWNSSTSTSTASQNYATTKAIAAPTRTGYTFVGWAETGPGSLAKVNNADPTFDSSNGGVGVYNNSGGGTVTHTRQSSSAGAAYGSYEILIKTLSGTTSPGNGGFYQNTQSAANKKYIHAFVAKIPTGYTVQQACNATGDGRTITWLTDRIGTGAFRVYAYQHNCGSTGTFSTFGHVYIETGTKPMSWQLACSAMKDITDGTADTYTYGAGAGRLTALWAGNKYSVIFNANGGSGTMSNQTDFFYGTAKALSANGFTAPSGGYSFQGWATSAANAAAGTVAYANGANMTTGTTTNGGTVTLYAVWKRTITFKHGKANATTSTATQYYGGNLTPPAITAVSGWTALGWRDDTSAGAKEYGANNTTAFAYTATATTLYATYSRTLTITYAANGGSGTTPSNTTTTQYYNSNGAITSPSVTLATNPYTKTNPNSTFNGWLVSTSNTTVASGGSYTWSIAVDATTVSRTATAQWLINLVLTPTAYSGAYNGSSHSASIKSNVADTTVGYSATSGNYTDYTATVGTSNVTLSGVSYVDYTNGAKTVYYKGTKSGYTTVTGTTTINITKRTVTWTAPTVNSSALTYNGSAKTLATAGSATTGGTMYYYVSTSATAPTFSTSTWKTSIDTKTNAGTYYIYYRCYVSDTTNNTGTNINTTYSINKTISQRTVTPTAPTLTTNTLTYDGNAKTLANVGSCTTGGTMYYYVSTSATAPTFDTSTWKTSIDTKTNAGTYYVHWYCYVSDISNNTGTNINTAKTLSARVINKASISPTITMASWAYGGTASTPSVSGNTGGGSVTYTYKLKSAADSAYSSTKPSDAGAYTVKAVVGETANYLSGTATKDFNITFTATATARTADYTGSAQSATIKTSAPGVVVSYGTSTSYGYSVTCTSANTNYAMSGVNVTNVIDSPKTVYYSATKNGYTVTGSTTVTINRVSAGPKPTTSVSKTYNGNNQNNGYTTPSGITMSGNNSGIDAGTYTAMYTPDNNHKWSDGTVDVVTITLTINPRTVTPTAPTLTQGDLTYNGGSKILANVGSCTVGGVMYYYVNNNDFTPSWSTSDTNWKTTIDTKVNAGTYYIYWYCYVENTNNNTGTNINTVNSIGSRVINKAPISPSVTMNGWIYGDTATDPSISGNTGNGTVTYTYKLKSAADSTYTAIKPTNAGTYTVKASIATTDNYQAGVATTNFTIEKRTVTITEPTLTTGTLVYDGSAKTLAKAGSATTGGVMYYYVTTSSIRPTFNKSTWSQSIATQVNAGTYYIYWYCYVEDINNNTGININTVNSLESRTINKATMTITPTAYSGDYNGIAYSASIKSSVSDTTISYGTTTNYGNSITVETSNVSMSAVTRINPGVTTIYYKATKANYNDVTGSTTITITGVPVHNKINGTWKHGIVYVNINGTWKKATIGYIKVNGSWTQITS